jgi:hypothetical protein
MKVVSQDNEPFKVTSKDILKGKLYTKDIIVEGNYWYTNVMLARRFGQRVLGTYSTQQDAQQVRNELISLTKAGAGGHFQMPEDMDDDDLRYAAAEFDESLEDD